MLAACESIQNYSTSAHSARGRGSSQNGAIVNDGGTWFASAASRAEKPSDVQRGPNGPPTSSWTPRGLRTRRSDVVPVPLPTRDVCRRVRPRVARVAVAPARLDAAEGDPNDGGSCTCASATRLRHACRGRLAVTTADVCMIASWSHERAIMHHFRHSSCGKTANIVVRRNDTCGARRVSNWAKNDHGSR